MPGKCSELALTLAKIARGHVELGATTIDQVVEEMQKTMPEVTRPRLVDSLIEVSDANKSAITDLQKRLQRFGREVRTDQQLTSKIKELETALATATLPASPKRKAADRTEAIQKLMDAKNSLLADVRKSEPALAAKYTKQINDNIQRLADTNFRMPEVREQDIEGSQQLQELRFKRDKTQRQVREKIESLRPKTPWEKGVNWMNAAKSLMATGEFSGIGRQGKFAAFVAPEAVPRSVVNMLRSFQSEEGQFKAHQEMMNDADMPRFSKAGLAISDIDGPLNQQEEGIMSPFAGKLPFFGKFDRAYNTYLNSLRFYAMKSIADTTFNGEATDTELHDIANAVNVFTGRGSLGPFEQSAAALNAGLFSPRYQMSRLQMLTGSPVWQSSTPNARQKILSRFYGRSLLGTGMMYGLYGLMFGGDDDYSLTFNPLSSDFGKIRVGDMRIDPLAGLAQPIVFLNKAVRGQEVNTTTKEVSDLRGEDAKHSRQSIVTQYLRSKMAPVPGALWNAVDGKDVVGNPTSVGGELLGLVTPMTYNTIGEVMQTEMGASEKLTASLLAFLGEGVSVYGSKK